MENQLYQQTPQKQSFQKKETERAGKERYYDDDEINLMDYFDVIKKRKKTIIVIFLIASVAAAVVSLILPKTFEAESLVRVGLFKKQSIETTADIKTIFANKNTLQEIAAKLDLPADTNLDGVKEKFDIKVSDGSDLLSLTGRGPTPEKAVTLVNTVGEMLIRRHEELFVEAQKTFDAEVATITAEREKTQKNIENIQKDLKRLDDDIKRYEWEVERRANIESEGQGRIAGNYINLLAGAKEAKVGKEDQILGLQQQLTNLDYALQQKNYEKIFETRPTVIGALPILPRTKISPQRTQIVMIAGVLGLFIGIFWAFVAEYFSKQKERL